MKRLFYTAFIFHSLMLKAQEIPPNANTIAIKGVTFKQVCMTLLDSGYLIDKKDNDLETVSTAPRDYPKLWNATYVISMRIKDSTCYFTATFTAPPGGGLFYNEPAYNHCKKNGQPLTKSMIRYPFMILNNFVSAFNRQIEFLKL